LRGEAFSGKCGGGGEEELRWVKEKRGVGGILIDGGARSTEKKKKKGSQARTGKGSPTREGKSALGAEKGKKKAICRSDAGPRRSKNGGKRKNQGEIQGEKPLQTKRGVHPDRRGYTREAESEGRGGKAGQWQKNLL